MKHSCRAIDPMTTGRKHLLRHIEATPTSVDASLSLHKYCSKCAAEFALNKNRSNLFADCRRKFVKLTSNLTSFGWLTDTDRPCAIELIAGNLRVKV